MGLIMQAEVLKKLVFDIQKLKTEKQTVELKSAEKGCPTKMKGSLLFLALDRKSVVWERVLSHV